ncbi:MAG: YARHG domain-containing protein [Clostridia bacterium]
MKKRNLSILAVLLTLVFLLSGCFLTPGGGGVPVNTTAPTGAQSASPSGGPGTTPLATVAPTAAGETAAPTKDPAATEGMVFRDSDTRLLMWDELIGLPVDTLGFAKNEIYARAGYVFQTKKYADYFGKYSWYQPDTGFSASKFTLVQLVNVKLISAAIAVLGGSLYYVPTGTKLDFDQDGVIETLTYSSPSNYSMKLALQDTGKPKAAVVKWNVACDTPSKKVYLGDLTAKDAVLDLFVDEFGPSDDYAIHVAGVKPTAFSARGTVPGWLSDFKLLGNGAVSTQKRMNILMTWFTKVKYQLNASSKLVFVAQKFYSMNHFKCKTKVALPLLKTSNIDAQETAFLIPVGKTIYLQTTDDKKWISIQYGSKTGWLLMADLYTILDPFAPATDIIDGLIIAD